MLCLGQTASWKICSSQHLALQQLVKQPHRQHISTLSLLPLETLL